MKVITLSTNGIEPARLVNVNYSQCGSYMAFLHGVSDVIILPVFIHDGWNYNLVPLIPDDNKYVLIRNGDNSTADEYLILWSLTPERFSDVSYAVESDDVEDECTPCPNVGYAVEGNGKTIAIGYDADGCTPCPVIHVTGPCRLLWGRAACYETFVPIMEAIFNGQDWTVRPINNEPVDSCDVKSTVDA
jgi:hypothetical protein